MASKSELWSQLRSAIKLYDSVYTFALGTYFTNYKALQDKLYGSNTLETATRMDSLKVALNNILADDYISATIKELARVGYSSIATTTTQCLHDIAAGMDAAGETVSSRGFTYNSIVNNAANIGDGMLIRSVVPYYGGLSDNGQPQAGKIKAEILTDSYTGGATVLDQETYIIKGDGNIGGDNIDIGGVPSTTLTSTVKNWASTGGNFALNGNFNTYTSGATLALNDWTLADNLAASVEMNTTALYNANVTSLQFNTNNKVSQLTSNWTAIADTTKPYFVIVPLKKLSSADGNVIISLGNQSLPAITASSLSTSTWTIAVFGLDEKGYYANWKVAGSAVSVELTGGTTGGIIIGGILVCQPDVFDGKYYCIYAGSMPYAIGDYWYVTDAVTNTGRINTTLARVYEVTLPHTSGTPTYADL